MLATRHKQRKSNEKISRTKRCLLTRDAQYWIGIRFSFMPLNSILGKTMWPNGSAWLGSTSKHQEKQRKKKKETAKKINIRN